MKQADKNIESLFKNLQQEVLGEQVPQDTPDQDKPDFNDTQTAAEDPVIAQVNTREELIALAESGKIKYSVQYIKKSSNASLDKIKKNYERSQLEETNEYVANNIITGVSKLLKYIELVKNTDELEYDLKTNDLLKRDLKNIVGTITPSIPYIGLMCGGATVGKHVAMNTFNGEKKTVLGPQTEECE